MSKEPPESVRLTVHVGECMFVIPVAPTVLLGDVASRVAAAYETIMVSETPLILEGLCVREEEGKLDETCAVSTLHSTCLKVLHAADGRKRSSTPMGFLDLAPKDAESLAVPDARPTRRSSITSAFRARIRSGSARDRSSSRERSPRKSSRRASLTLPPASEPWEIPESLADVMSSPRSLAALTLVAEKRFILEFVHALRLFNEYERSIERGERERAARIARNLVADYLDDGAPMELNVEATLRRETAAAYHADPEALDKQTFANVSFDCDRKLRTALWPDYVKMRADVVDTKAAGFLCPVCSESVSVAECTCTLCLRAVCQRCFRISRSRCLQCSTKHASGTSNTLSFLPGALGCGWAGFGPADGSKKLRTTFLVCLGRSVEVVVTRRLGATHLEPKVHRMSHSTLPDKIQQKLGVRMEFTVSSEHNAAPVFKLGVSAEDCQVLAERVGAILGGEPPEHPGDLFVRVLDLSRKKQNHLLRITHSGVAELFSIKPLYVFELEENWVASPQMFAEDKDFPYRIQVSSAYVLGFAAPLQASLWARLLSPELGEETESEDSTVMRLARGTLRKSLLWEDSDTTQISGDGGDLFEGEVLSEDDEFSARALRLTPQSDSAMLM